ncbi:hypothetical protein [Actinomadura sp. CNU-125]|uniref:hypothetical protein n=1 Tax=Actinomadura sp. CNU-125 TaxID=1904961 RepID=UPI0039670797
MSLLPVAASPAVCQVSSTEYWSRSRTTETKSATGVPFQSRSPAMPPRMTPSVCRQPDENDQRPDTR